MSVLHKTKYLALHFAHVSPKSSDYFNALATVLSKYGLSQILLKAEVKLHSLLMATVTRLIQEKRLKAYGMIEK